MADQPGPVPFPPTARLSIQGHPAARLKRTNVEFPDPKVGEWTLGLLNMRLQCLLPSFPPKTKRLAYPSSPYWKRTLTPIRRSWRMLQPNGRLGQTKPLNQGSWWMKQVRRHSRPLAFRRVFWKAARFITGGFASRIPRAIGPVGRKFGVSQLLLKAGAEVVAVVRQDHCREPLGCFFL